MMISLSLVKNTIARNTLYNLIGYGIPLVFAFLFIPSLIANLGDERYGILNLSWIVVGYFSFLDFGFSKALTKTISEKIGMDQIDEIPGLFWTTLVIILLISLIFTILALNFVTDVSVIFNISENAKLVSVKTFYLLALLIPIVATMAGLRGFLEAYQKFGSINFIRIILGVSTFLGPLIILMITISLFWITFFFLGIMVVVGFYSLLMCFKLNSNLKSNIPANFNYLKHLISFSI